MFDDDAVAGTVDLDKRHAVSLVALQVAAVAGRRHLILQALNDEHRRRTT
jgi:hypothetical protein